MTGVERMRQLRALRRAQGRCYSCGSRTELDAFKACAECRETLRPQRAEYMRAYRRGRLEVQS